MYRLRSVFGPHVGQYVSFNTWGEDWTTCMDKAETFRYHTGLRSIKHFYTEGDIVVPELRADVDTRYDRNHALEALSLILKHKVNGPDFTRRHPFRIIHFIVRRDHEFTQREPEEPDYDREFTWDRWYLMGKAYRGT